MTRIKIALVKKNVECVADLHENLAPKTCSAILSVLPCEMIALHALSSGREIWGSLPTNDLLRKVTPENQTAFPIPGDILYGYFPPANKGGFRGVEEEISDFALFYGRDSQPRFEAYNPVPMNHWASITENLDKFAIASASLLTEGADRFRITRF